MEIRGAKESELAEVVDLNCLVFRPTEAEAPARYWSYLREESTYELEQSRVLVDQGRVVAHLRVWDRQIRVRKAHLRVGGIGSVLTHPDFRGRGYARALLRDAEAYMARSGYDLGMLFTIIGTSFYAKLDWVPIPLPTFALDLDQHGETPTTLGRNLDLERDLSSLIALYDAANADLTGTEVRTEAYWKSGPSRYRDLFPNKGIEQNGQLVGYLNYAVNTNDLEVREACFAPGNSRACNETALILFAEARQKGLQAIKGSLPIDHPLIERLCELSDAQLHWSQHEKTMVKVLNWPDLTAKLGVQATPGTPSDESQFWNELFNPASESTPSWLSKLPPARGFFYWEPDVF